METTHTKAAANDYQSVECFLNSRSSLGCSIDISPDGMKAIVTLSSGDMRRSLNILQVRPTSAEKQSTCHWVVMVSCTDSPLWFPEHQHGVREGDGGHGVHLHRSPAACRHRQHPRLVPQQRLHHGLQTYPPPPLAAPQSAAFVLSSSFLVLNSIPTEILQLKTLKGLALHDILTEVHLLIHRGEGQDSSQISHK